MKKNIFAVCLAGTVLLAAGVVFLPRYISRSLDLRSINRVVLTDRDTFSYMEPSAYDLPGNDAGFKSLQDGTGELTLIASFDRQTVKLNEELLQGIEEEMFTFSEAMGYDIWFPYDTSAETYSDAEAYSGGNAYLYSKISSGYGIASPDQAESAEYYSLVYPSEEDSRVKQMLNFWVVHYTDTLSMDSYFLGNEDNYKIYYAWIYNTRTEEICSLLEMASEEQNPKELERYVWDAFSLATAAEGCLYYYEAEFYDEISWPETLSMKNPAAVSMVFGAEKIVGEERPLPASRRGCRGLGIGLQSAGAALSPDEKETNDRG